MNARAFIRNYKRFLNDALAGSKPHVTGWQIPLLRGRKRAGSRQQIILLILSSFHSVPSSTLH